MSSASDLLSALESIRVDNCVSLVIVTAIVYDYILNFSREVEYIWCKPWTSITAMYVLVRYIGLYWGVASIAGSTFVPGPVTVSTVIFLVCSWAFPVFLGAADLIMILRVYTMWDRSKKILGILLFIYVPQIISAFVFTGIYNNPKSYFSVSIAQVLDLAYCNYANSALVSTFLYFMVPRFVFSVVLFVLAITQTLKESVRFYRAMNQWQINEFVGLLARDGIFYFAMNVVFNISVVLQQGPQWNTASLLILSMLNFVSFCPLVPRFVLDLREMHDRSLVGNSVHGLDSASGGWSQPIPAFARDVTTSGMLSSSDIGSGEDLAIEVGLDGSEAIRLGTMAKSGARQV
ncbi:hypothetical protein EV363DRAFT_1182854 [Boletus edulis]|nr:hypothetical protein EV363DRAFT_1182854 [Boletus edulis]